MRIWILLLCGLLAACTTPIERGPDSLRSRPAALVLLVSIDGMRVDYLQRGLTPNLQRLIDDGVRARWMTPSYPSLTFPNHYTLVTGVHPDRHGIVHNTMQDAQLSDFALSNRQAVGDPRWWQAEPIWVSAERAGIPTAPLFWPGSEARIGGFRPQLWRPYDVDFSYQQRIDTIVQWLTERAGQTPANGFATLYFEYVDKMGHEHGPDSTELNAALAQADAAIGELLQQLQAAGIADQLNLVIVSDHGMATVPPQNYLLDEQMVDPSLGSWVSLGQSAGFQPHPDQLQAAEAQLLGRHPHYQCWRRSELPHRWHYGSHPRVPPIVCQLDEGWDVLNRRALLWRQRLTGPRGSHGFDPALPSMRTIFIAHGPAFASGVELPPIDSVDVQPLLARLLGLTVGEVDGDPAALSGALRDP